MGIFDYFKKIGNYLINSGLNRQNQIHQNDVNYKESTESKSEKRLKSNNTEVEFANSEFNSIYKEKLEVGLIPGELVLMDWLDGKKKNSKLPQYYYYKYGLNTNKSIKYLIENDYLREALPEESLSSLKVTELKEILREENIKISGNKKNLIDRIKSNLTNEQIQKYQTETVMIISNKGKEVLKKYYYIVPAHKNNSYDNVYNVANAIKFVKKFKGDFKPLNGDISWQLFQKDFIANQINGDYGLATNNLRSMARQLKKEKKYKNYLNYLIKVFIMDMSGLSNGRLVHGSDVITGASGIVDEIEKIKVEINKKEFVDIYNQAWQEIFPSIPFHYLTKEECKECLFYALKKDNLSIIKMIELKEENIENKFEIENKYNLTFTKNLREKIMKELDERGL